MILLFQQNDVVLLEEVAETLFAIVHLLQTRARLSLLFLTCRLFVLRLLCLVLQSILMMKRIEVCPDRNQNYDLYR